MKGVKNTLKMATEGWKPLGAGGVKRNQSWKKSFSVFRLHYTQNDRLDLTVSTQKSVLQNMHRIPNIGQNVLKFEGLVWQVKFRHIFINILGPDAYFSKPIFALKPWAQAQALFLQLGIQFYTESVNVGKVLFGVSFLYYSPVHVRTSGHFFEIFRKGSH